MLARLLLLALACGLAAGCSDSRPGSLDRPVVVIGIDSADWTWIDPRLQSGHMPHLAALVERGTRASLLSLQPAQKSPTIWTSIATGKRPVKHGIAGFIDHGGDVEKAGHRSAATYWEILGAVGRSQAVIGWWVTYPATPVEGVLVSDYVQYFGADDPVEGAVFPPERWEELAPLRVFAESIPLEQLGRFVDLEVARQHGEEAEKLLTELRWIVAADETFRAMARHLYASQPFDVFTVYFRGLDAVSHRYWRYFEPRHAGLPVEDWQVALLGEVIPRYHDFVDELVGEILGYVDPQSRVMICSDHGFVGHRRQPSGLTLGVGMHRDHGILVLAGPDIRAGHELAQAEVKDLMPTLLALCGLPPARDVDGHVLLDAFSPRLRAWSETLAAQTVSSYESLVPDRKVGDLETPAADAEVLERLRALGYID